MTPSRKTPVAIACVAALQAVALVYLFAKVDLSPGSVGPRTRWAAAIMWFPIGYLPEELLAPMRALPPLLYACTLAGLNGLIWGVTIVMGLDRRCHAGSSTCPRGGGEMTKAGLSTAESATSRNAARPSNKGMKLTKLSAAPLLGRSAASCPRRSTSDAGTASQLIPGVRLTCGGE